MISIEKAIEYGKYFGYPQCCIDAFTARLERINKTGDFSLTRMQTDAQNGQGFIPCNVCSSKILLGGIKISDLINNRICPTPYPVES